MKALESFWYRPKNWLGYLLLPLHLILCILVYLRKFIAERRAKEILDAPPVVVIGNINVGGTGKTPLIIHLIEEFTERGLKVGVVSRGYGGHAEAYPMLIDENTNASEGGDEPVLIHRTTGAPVAVAPQRRAAVLELMRKDKLDLILSDDGLQHYAMPRDFEVVVADAERGFGNGLLMPFGPLREPLSRLSSVDAFVSTGDSLRIDAALPRFVSKLIISSVSRLNSSEEMTIANYIKESNGPVNAVCGIGNPERYFLALEALGLQIIRHPFPDHHRFTSADFEALEGDILMTTKDAVKCESIAKDNLYQVHLTTEVTPSLTEYICQRLEL